MVVVAIYIFFFLGGGVHGPENISKDQKKQYDTGHCINCQFS